MQLVKTRKHDGLTMQTAVQAGYAAGIQVTVNVSLDSGDGRKPVQISNGVQQVAVCEQSQAAAE